MLAPVLLVSLVPVLGIVAMQHEKRVKEGRLAAVAFQRAQFAAGFQIPHFQRFVPGGGHGPLALRAHRHPIDRVRVPCQRAQLTIRALVV